MAAQTRWPCRPSDQTRRVHVHGCNIEGVRIDEFLAIPVHAFLRLSLEGDSLGISYLDDSWLKENIENDKIRIKHELVDDDILLTASTKELQQLVVNCAEDKEAFEMEYTHRLK